MDIDVTARVLAILVNSMVCGLYGYWCYRRGKAAGMAESARHHIPKVSVR